MKNMLLQILSLEEEIRINSKQESIDAINRSVPKKQQTIVCNDDAPVTHAMND